METRHDNAKGQQNKISRRNNPTALNNQQSTSILTCVAAPRTPLLNAAAGREVHTHSLRGDQRL
jgi:hypothetical protein